MRHVAGHERRADTRGHASATRSLATALAVAAASSLGASASGCLSSVDLALPPAQDDRTLVLISDPDGEPEAWTLEAAQGRWVGPDGAPPRFAVRSRDLRLFEYAVGARGLQLSPGRLELVAAEAPGRPLPRPDASWAGVPEGPHVRWGPAELPTDAELSRLRVSPFDVAGCAEAGGCTVSPSAPICKLPCIPVGPPEAPAPPRLPPPPGWAALSLDGAPVLGPDGAAVHAPVEPARLECPRGQMRLPDEDACRPVAACPPPGGWPEDAPPDAVYVRAGARGAGSPDDPFGALDIALAAAPSAPVVFEGRFALEPLLDEIDGRRLIGVCPARATLATESSTKTVSGVELVLERARLELASTLELSDPGAQHVLRAVDHEGMDLAIVGGSLRLEDSRLHNPDDVAVVASFGARLDLARVFLLGPYGVHLFEGARLTVRDGLFEAVGGDAGHGVSCGKCGPVDFERFVIRGYRGDGIGGDRTPSIRAVDGQILDVASHGISLAPCGSGDCLPALRDAPTFEIEARRLRIRSGRNAVRAFSSALRLEDAVLEPGTVGVSGRAEPEYTTHVEVRRSVIIGMDEEAIELEAGPGAAHTADIQDLLVLQDPRAQREVEPTVWASFVELSLARAHIEGGIQDGLRIACAGAEIEDVTIDGAARDGVNLAPGAPIRATRLSVRGVRRDAVRIYPSDPGAVAETDACSTVLVDPTPSVELSQVELRGEANEGRGLTVCSGGPTTASDVVVEGFDTGLYVQADLQLLDRAWLTDNEVGISTSPDFDLAGALREVRIDGGLLLVEPRDAPGGCP